MSFGPTAGHVYPALSFVEAYQRLDSDVRVLFIGARTGAFSVPDHLTQARMSITSSPLAGAALRGKLRGIVDAVIGLREVRPVLRAHGVRLAVGFGGHASGPLLLAARSIGARAVIHEANAIRGRANLFLGPFVDRVYLGWRNADAGFPRVRSIFTGTPIRRDVAQLAEKMKSAPPPDRPGRIVVLTGTAGGTFMVQRLPALFAELRRRGCPLEIRHQTADVDPQEVHRAYTRAGLSVQAVRTFEDIATHYAWADCVVCRAGASTLAELTAAGLPAVLIPLASASDDHQSANARAYAAAGAAFVAAEKSWEPSGVADHLQALLTAEAAWSYAASAARRLFAADAASRMVNDCESLMEGRW